MIVPTKKIITILLLTFSSLISNAQEIIADSVKVKPTPKSNANKIKIDGIIATVGDYVVLDSDIDKAFLEIQGQGGSVKDITRCQMLSSLLKEKLFAHQAIQDSIIVSDAEIKEKMDQQLDYMLEQLGSMDKVLQYFKKSSEDDFRTDFFEILKQQRLASEMQQKIISEIEITPEETRNFFKKIPENELPQFGAELEIAQIVIKPKISEEEKQRIISKLKEIKKEVQEGASFKTRAVIYTDDRASAATGGFYKINKKTPFVKEFKDVAFSLQEGEISEPFETMFGYHIIYLEKIKGLELELRHILMMPKVSPESLKEAKEKADLIKKRIEDKEITFAEAARTMSDEKETKANGGTLINPKTQDTRFELTKMDPELYGQVSNLKDNEVSIPYLMEDPKEGKMYKILMVTNRIDQHTADYSKDYTKIRELALKEKQISAISKWTDEKINETYIRINADYQGCDFESNWLKK
ncbi:peptidylprolyl isomerase [Flavobacterium sp.]|uniref:peptidylprolyl isomerase n=1 Tax=Flavobacterium sp. TaxID=239 RepID=UPI002B4AC234|nr:peptidylprolyl isomerase [Flavobacterium sp.]HLP65871.1 peptidylprolyl isomerase [Flavobacterium sp.]